MSRTSQPDSAGRSVTVHAHAKLNISLAIGPRRAGDGYHLLESLMVPLDLHDEVTVAKSAGGFRLEVTGPTIAGVPTDSSNLAWRSAQLLATEAGLSEIPSPNALETPGGGGGISANLSIRLHKQIPVGGGLAGGSADAAATLIGLNELWNLNWPVERLAALGARLGSDVPFCTISRPSWVRGRGERVEPLAESLPPLWAVLILPGLAVSTRAVYQRLDADRLAGIARPGRKHQLGLLECFNDLEQAALSVSRPLAETFGSLEAFGTPRLMVAGSGSTLFALFDNASQAREWENRIRLEARCAVMVAAVLSDTSNCRRPHRP